MSDPKSSKTVEESKSVAEPFPLLYHVANLGEPGATHGCWLWTGGRDRDGYGQVNVRLTDGRRTTRRAHHIAYEWRYGSLPEGAVVRHTCDNPTCINPDHLRVGTHGDNVADKVAKGRQARGERHGAARLTEADADAIRHSNLTGAELAKHYGVCDATIYAIRNGRTWQEPRPPKTPVPHSGTLPGCATSRPAAHPTSQHSPGPWFYGRSEYPEQFYILPSHSWVTLAHVHNYSAEEREANARLIAAAPELLEALREIVKCECPFRVDPLEHCNEAVEHMRGLARAAIAKAEGR